MKKDIFLFYLIVSLINAIIYGLFTYFIIYKMIARENLLITSYLNIIYIIIGLIITDKARNFGLLKRDLIIEIYKEMGIIFKTFYAVTQVSFRPGMYVFYILVLIFSQMYTFESDIMPYYLGNFFHSIEYGLLVLITFDSLKVLLLNEWKWFKKNVDPEINDKDV
ncbi:MAG: hypothetical protein FWD14_06915 [Treponema sp.]|nr:hypothetical protein [Treponema sp.]